MLTVRNLTKRYGPVVAVDDISFTVPDGVCFGLLGPNGAGKTTTISIIAGTTDADTGDVELGGVVARSSPATVKKRIGYVPQEIAVYEDLSAVANLRFFAALYGIFGPEADHAADKALDVVGLKERSHEPVRQFSGGMKRRLNIAVGLLHDPDLLIFDEPTVGVDPQSRNAIFDCLLALRNSKKTILYTTHYMEEVERLCQEVAIMDHGKIVSQGDIRSLKESGRSSLEVMLELTEECHLVADADIPSTLEWSAEGKRLLLKLPDLDTALGEALQWLAAQGIRVVAVKSAEASLEQVFLEATGRSLRD